MHACMCALVCMAPHLLLQAELAAETVAIERDKHARLQSEPLLAQQIDALRAECVCVCPS